MSDNKNNNGSGNNGLGQIFSKGPYDNNPDKYKQTKGFLRNSSSGPKTLILAIFSLLGLIISIIDFKNHGR